MMPDFGDGKTVLQDAYADLRIKPAIGLRAGKFKVPFGLERLQSATSVPFLERALPNNLVPNRDVGLQVQGQFLEGAISYAAGVFNGVPDGGSADIDVNNGKDVAGRAFFQPFRKPATVSLQGLGLGIAATYGDNRGTPASSGLGPYRTVAQQAFFTYRIGVTDATAVVAEGRGVRLSPQLYYFVGWFGLMADRVSSAHEVRIGGQTESLENDAWQTTVMFVLTGEKASYQGVVPKDPIGAKWNDGGAVELVARYGELAIDDATFPLFADPAVSARGAREGAVGVNWYLNRHAKLMVDASVTRFDGGGASGGDREDERVLLTRVQLAF
jgi:phosphate-selective porin OprO/OprP